LPVLSGFSAYVAATADAANGYIYYMDSAANIIYRRQTNGSGKIT